MRKVEKGLTLIEAAMVLAISTLVVAGIMIFYSSASMSTKANDLLEEVLSIQQGVRELYVGQSSYDGLALEQIIAANKVPGSMIVNSSQLSNAFGGGIDIGSIDINGVTAGTFFVEIDNIPIEGCIALATKDMGTSIHEYYINNTPINLPITVPDVTTACNQGVSSTLTTNMRWVFVNF